MQTSFLADTATGVSAVTRWLRSSSVAGLIQTACALSAAGAERLHASATRLPIGVPAASAGAATASPAPMSGGRQPLASRFMPTSPRPGSGAAGRPTWPPTWPPPWPPRSTGEGGVSAWMLQSRKLTR